MVDTSKEKTIEGTIVKIEKMKINRNGISKAVVLEVKTSEGIQKVFLGPEWFLNQNQVQLREKQKIKLVAFETVMNGETMLLVREMMMAENKITLRDKNGFPQWGGPKGRMRKGPRM